MTLRLRDTLCAGVAFTALLSVPPIVAQESATAPLTLDRAIAAALDSNPDLLAFGFEVRGQEARARQAGQRILDGTTGRRSHVA